MSENGQPDPIPPATTGAAEKTPAFRWKKRYSALLGVVGFLGGGLVGSLVATLTQQGDFSVTMFAALGAWLSGIGTLGAVSVAIIQTNRANEQARAAEARTDELQEDATKARVREEEIRAVSEIARAADLFINSVRRYYDVTGTISLAEDTHENLLTLIQVQADMADSVSESFRTINLAALNLETESLIEEYIMLTSALETIKVDVAKLKPGARNARDIEALVNESSQTVSMAKDNLFHVARQAHSTTNIYPILARLQKQVDKLQSTMTSNEPKVDTEEKT